MRRLVVLALLLIAPTSAIAGGDPPQLAACGNTVWIAGAGALSSVNAASSRTTSWRVAPSWYPIAVACHAHFAWIAMVTNGFTAGRIDRVEVGTHRLTTVLHHGNGGFTGMAASSNGQIWAIDGSRRRIWRIAPGPTRPIPGTAGSEAIAGGGSSVWAVGDPATLRQVDATSIGTPLARSAGAPIIACANHTLVPLRSSLLDLPSGRRLPWPAGIRAIPLACQGNEALLRRPSNGRSTRLLRIDLQTGRLLRVATVANNVTSGAATAHALWLAIWSTGPRILELDPITLHLRRNQALPAR